MVKMLKTLIKLVGKSKTNSNRNRIFHRYELISIQIKLQQLSTHLSTVKGIRLIRAAMKLNQAFNRVDLDQEQSCSTHYLR